MRMEKIQLFSAELEPQLEGFSEGFSEEFR